MPLRTGDRSGRHKLENAEFDFNRGTEGQIQARKNSKGEVELVAYFGDKWYFCPMAEFNKTLNLRHGAQVNGSDIMTASQTDSSGFNLMRLNTVSSEASPKLNEAVIFIDSVPATGVGTIVATFAINSTELTYASGTTTNLKVGLNVTDVTDSDAFQPESFITALTQSDNSAWVDQVDDAADLDTIHISTPTAVAESSGDTIAFGTRSASHPNAFFNIVYNDPASATYYYHKFQLNSNIRPAFGSNFNQIVYGGRQGGGGGTGGSSSGGSGSGGGGGPK